MLQGIVEYTWGSQIDPFNDNCSKLLLFEGFSNERQSTRMSKIINGGLDQYGKV